MCKMVSDENLWSDAHDAATTNKVEDILKILTVYVHRPSIATTAELKTYISA